VPPSLQDQLQRQHDDEVEHRRRQHEGQQRVQEVAPREGLAVHLERATGRPAAAGQPDQRPEERLGERRDDGSEGGADDDGHGQVDDVAAEQEVLESLDHASIHAHGSRGRDQGRRRVTAAGG
jgi:hypothetical protein